MPGSWNSVGQPGAIQKLQDALMRLEGTRIGHSLAEIIHERGTMVRFGQTPRNAIAYFAWKRNEIVVGEGARDSSPNVLAQHLAHEGTHVQWGRDNSIDQEYHAFKAEAKVWNQLKGSEANDQCDWVSRMISLGKEEAMNIIHDLYPNLPKYA